MVCFETTAEEPIRLWKKQQSMNESPKSRQVLKLSGGVRRIIEFFSYPHFGVENPSQVLQ